MLKTILCLFLFSFPIYSQPKWDYRWPLGDVKVYVAPGFTADQQVAIQHAMASWRPVNFVYAGTTDQIVKDEYSLTITRANITDPTRYAFLHTMTYPVSNYIRYAYIELDNRTVDPNVVQAMVAHELGHSLGLSDCLKCKSIMSTFPGVNKTNGLHGPTADDQQAVTNLYAVDLLKHQAAKYVNQLRNVVAEQSTVMEGKTSIYSVLNDDRDQLFRKDGALTGGIPVPKKGIRPGDEWRGMVGDLSFMDVKYDGQFTYSGTCYWQEKNFSDRVGCDGVIEVDADYNPVRITRVFHPYSEFREIAMTMTFQWIDLKGRRLVPASLEMTGADKHGRKYQSSTTWSRYEEYRASEPTVTEVEP
jgi:hypothetical protein